MQKEQSSNGGKRKAAAPPPAQKEVKQQHPKKVHREEDQHEVQSKGPAAGEKRHKPSAPTTAKPLAPSPQQSAKKVTEPTKTPVKSESGTSHKVASSQKTSTAAKGGNVAKQVAPPTVPFYAKSRSKIVAKIVPIDTTGSKVKDRNHWAKALDRERIDRLELKVSKAKSSFMEWDLRLTVGPGEVAPLVVFVTEPVRVLGASLTGTGKIYTTQGKKGEMCESRYSLTYRLNEFDETIVKNDPDVIERQAAMVDAMLYLCSTTLELMWKNPLVCQVGKKELNVAAAATLSRDEGKTISQVMKEKSKKFQDEVKCRFMEAASVFFNEKQMTDENISKYGEYDNSHLDKLDDITSKQNGNYIMCVNQRAFWAVKPQDGADGRPPMVAPPIQVTPAPAKAAPTLAGTVEELGNDLSNTTVTDQIGLAAALMKTISDMRLAGFDFSEPKIYSKDGVNLFNRNNPYARIIMRNDYAEVMLSCRPTSRLTPLAGYGISFDLKCMWLVLKSPANFVDYSSQTSYAPSAKTFGKMMSGDLKPDGQESGESGDDGADEEKAGSNGKAKAIESGKPGLVVERNTTEKTFVSKSRPAATDEDSQNVDVQEGGTEVTENEQEEEEVSVQEDVNGEGGDTEPENNETEQEVESVEPEEGYVTEEAQVEDQQMVDAEAETEVEAEAETEEVEANE